MRSVLKIFCLMIANWDYQEYKKAKLLQSNKLLAFVDWIIPAHQIHTLLLTSSLLSKVKSSIKSVSFVIYATYGVASWFALSSFKYRIALWNCEFDAYFPFCVIWCVSVKQQCCAIEKSNSHQMTFEWIP